MIAHTTLPISDFAKSKAFYSKVLRTLGYHNNLSYAESAGFNDGTNTDFWIAHKNPVVPMHLAFEAKSRAEVEAFHAAGLAAGGVDNGRADYREYSPGYFASFILDPDGNNIEAVWYDPHKA